MDTNKRLTLELKDQKVNQVVAVSELQVLSTNARDAEGNAECDLRLSESAVVLTFEDHEPHRICQYRS